MTRGQRNLRRTFLGLGLAKSCARAYERCVPYRTLSGPRLSDHTALEVLWTLAGKQRRPLAVSHNIKRRGESPTGDERQNNV